MKNGEVIDFGAYKKTKKIKNLERGLSNEKRSFLNWFNELPVELRKRAEKIGMKKLEVIRGFENKFHFPQGIIEEAETELEEKTEAELLEMIKQTELDKVKQTEAIRLSLAVQRIIYQESSNEE